MGTNMYAQERKGGGMNDHIVAACLHSQGKNVVIHGKINGE